MTDPDESDETRLARAAISAISAFEQLPKTSPRRAAWQHFTVVAEHCSEVGLDVLDLVNLLFLLEEERHREHLGE